MGFSQILLFVGALAGIVLMLTIFQTVNNREPLKEKRTALLILLAITVFGITGSVYLQSGENERQAEASQVTLQADPIKSKYLGDWTGARDKGKVLIQIYEENGGLFAKFWQGDIMPLKFQQEGQYYEGSTALGTMPFIIRNDTLQYSQSKYVRAQTQAAN